MTRYLLDVASYQGALKPADVKRAGFSVVNLKVSHELGQKAVHPDIAGWIRECRALGLGIGTFHWLTGGASGAAQAKYAYGRLTALGLTKGTAHTVDCEADASLAIATDYCKTMTGLLGRPIALYTGDWWWNTPVRGWKGSTLSPYLWASPNAGYLPTYPGDTSSHWNAGYGGWPTLAVMQYAVQVLIFPDGTHGSIKVSKSAIRDEKVWTALTGGTVAWNPPRGSKPDYTLLPDSQTHPWLLTTKITKAHRWFVERLLAMETGTELGGTYSDKPGYHNMRSRLPADDYSVRQPVDQQGPDDKGAGTDWTHPDAHNGDYTSMVKYGKRMRASYNDRSDPRLAGWREALGQFDADAPPEAIDFRGRYERVPDDTHKWHWHFSETRAHVESFGNKWAFLTVLLGWTTAEWQQSTGADDMPTADEIARAVWGFKPAADKAGSVWPGVPGDTYGQPGVAIAPGTVLGSILARQKAQTDAGRAAVADLIAAVRQAGNVDLAALAAAIAPAVAGAVIEALPSGTDPVSVDEVKTALEHVLAEAFSRPGT